MKILKKTTILIILVIGFFAFSKKESKTHKSSFNLAKTNVIQLLSDQQFECRPSSKMTFYVEAKLVNKSRGYNTINTSVYILDRASGVSNLLANENIIVPTHKDAILHYDTTKSNCGKEVLSNGDKVIGSDVFAPYCFNELVQFQPVYSSYIRATNKLLKMNRSI